MLPISKSPVRGVEKSILLLQAPPLAPVQLCYRALRHCSWKSSFPRAAALDALAAPSGSMPGAKVHLCWHWIVICSLGKHVGCMLLSISESRFLLCRRLAHLSSLSTENSLLAWFGAALKHMLSISGPHPSRLLIKTTCRTNCLPQQLTPALPRLSLTISGWDPRYSSLLWWLSPLPSAFLKIMIKNFK